MSLYKFLIFFFCLFTFNLYAQKSQIGFYISPNIASTKLSGYYQQSSIQYDTLKEGNRIGFDAGLFYKYSIKERLKIGLGVGYSLKGFTILEWKDGNNNPLLNPNTTLKVSYQYLEIPIFITYSIIKKSWFELYPSIGFSNNFLLNEPKDVFYGLRSYKTYTLGLQLGAGFSFYPSKNIAINLEPTEKLFLSPVAVDKYTHPISRRLYSFGMKIGLGFVF